MISICPCFIILALLRGGSIPLIAIATGGVIGGTLAAGSQLLLLFEFCEGLRGVKVWTCDGDVEGDGWINADWRLEGGEALVGSL